MTEQDHKPDDQHDISRQVRQRREHSHRRADHPDHLEEREVVVEVEEEAEAYHHDLQQDEPQPAR